MGKSENYLFLGNFCSLRSQCWFKHSTKELSMLNEIKGHGSSLTLAISLSDFNIKTCFSKKVLKPLKPNFI